MFGAEHPSTKPSYTYKYAYRGLVPMAKAIEAVGEERAQNACMHVSDQSCPRSRTQLIISDQMGPDGHMLTFPANHGQTLNIVAFRTTSYEWSDSQRLTRSATREEALRGHEGYGRNVINLLKLTEPHLDVVSNVYLRIEV